MTSINATIAAFNESARHFNEMRYAEAKASIRQFIQGVDENRDQVINLLTAMKDARVICLLVRDVEAVEWIDSILRAFMGEGIEGYNKEKDAEIRLDANALVALQNIDRETFAKAFGEFLEKYRNGAALTYHQVEVMDTVRALGVRQGLFDLVRKTREDFLRLKTQEIVSLSNRGIMHNVDYGAIDYPQTVTIETYSRCNARCTFCAYPKLADGGRVGTKMPKKLFLKIIRDLQDIPRDHQLSINLTRVNEPLLDTRIFDFISIIEDKLPGATVFMPTNGSLLTARNIEKLSAHRNITLLMVSLNATEKEAYRALMGLDFDRTLKNLDRLHKAVEKGVIGFRVGLTAVSKDAEEFEHFKAWCAARFPLFPTGSYPKVNWFDEVDTDVADRPAVVASCKDWYQVHILADGSEAQCCFDAYGKYGDGNVRDRHILELYNKPWQRRLRRLGAIRESAIAPEFCRNCNYL